MRPRATATRVGRESGRRPPSQGRGRRCWSPVRDRDGGSRRPDRCRRACRVDPPGAVAAGHGVPGVIGHVGLSRVTCRARGNGRSSPAPKARLGARWPRRRRRREPGGATHHVQTIGRVGRRTRRLRTRTAGSAAILGGRKFGRLAPILGSKSGRLTSDVGQQTSLEANSSAFGCRSWRSPLNSRGPCGPFLRPFGVRESRPSVVSSLSAVSEFGFRFLPPSSPFNEVSLRPLAALAFPPSPAPARPRAPRSQVYRRFSRRAPPS
jgi:hypothetical protein